MSAVAVAAEPRRFDDARAEYFAFLLNAKEKPVIASRMVRAFNATAPENAVVIRVFDAGVGAGIVLAQSLHGIHGRFPNTPFVVVAKEVSGTDVEQAAAKIPAILVAYPETGFVVTNMKFAQAPRLMPKDPNNTYRHEIKLWGKTEAEFQEQLAHLPRFLNDHWQHSVSFQPKKEATLIISREDQSRTLGGFLPQRDQPYDAGYNFIIASQPFRLEQTASFKGKLIMAPLVRSLAPGGSLLCVQACGGDPGHDIVKNVLPDSNYFAISLHHVAGEIQKALGDDAQHFDFNTEGAFSYNLNVTADQARALEQGDVEEGLLANAWRSVVYVAQIDRDTAQEAEAKGSWQGPVRESLIANKGLGFMDQELLITRHL